MRILRYCVAIMMAILVFGITLAYSKELAKFDGFVISDTDFKKRMMIIPERQRAKTMQDKEKFLNKMIDEELLLREAQKLNLCDNDEYKFTVETFKRELLVNFFLEHYLKENNTEENQRKYFEENKEKYTEVGRVRISIISVETEDEAKEILKKAQDGENFAELAKKYSKGPFVSRGGDFGYRTKGSLKTEIAEAAFSMKKDEISGPVKTADGGYHIIKLADHIEGGIPKFEAIKDKIAFEYSRKLIEMKLADVRKAVNIQINTDELENRKTD